MVESGRVTDTVVPVSGALVWPRGADRYNTSWRQPRWRHGHTQRRRVSASRAGLAHNTGQRWSRRVVVTPAAGDIGAQSAFPSRLCA